MGLNADSPASTPTDARSAGAEQRPMREWAEGWMRTRCPDSRTASTSRKVGLKTNAPAALLCGSATRAFEKGSGGDLLSHSVT